MTPNSDGAGARRRGGGCGTGDSAGSCGRLRRKRRWEARYQVSNVTTLNPDMNHEILGGEKKDPYSG